MDYKSKVMEILQKMDNQEIFALIYGILIGNKGKD